MPDERSAKDIRVAPISVTDARACVRLHHYSGTFTRNSQLNLGVFLDGALEGVMQFGPSLDKRKIHGLVKDTAWNGFLELNRLAFSDRLPRNSESRALGVAFRMIRKHYPHIEWVVSFADGTQCGDGTIYRASGFVLTGITKNKTIWRSPSGEIGTDLSLKQGQTATRQTLTARPTGPKARGILATGGVAGFDGASSMKAFKDAGWQPIPGFQLRYIYFLNPAARPRLTVPEIPFAKIDELGASMYKGVRRKQAMAGDQPAQRRGSDDLSAPAREGRPTRSGKGGPRRKK